MRGCNLKNKLASLETTISVAKNIIISNQPTKVTEYNQERLQLDKSYFHQTMTNLEIVSNLATFISGWGNWKHLLSSKGRKFSIPKLFSLFVWRHILWCLECSTFVHWSDVNLEELESRILEKKRDKCELMHHQPILWLVQNSQIIFDMLHL